MKIKATMTITNRATGISGMATYEGEGAHILLNRFLMSVIKSPKQSKMSIVISDNGLHEIKGASRISDNFSYDYHFSGDFIENLV